MISNYRTNKVNLKINERKSQTTSVELKYRNNKMVTGMDTGNLSY